MSTTYPGSVDVYSQKQDTPGTVSGLPFTVYAQHINDIQDAIVAIESNVVDAVNDQTIGGIKTFSQVPAIPGYMRLSGAQTVAGATTFSGDVYMGSGAPWVDVKAHGAVGDGSTDDTNAIMFALQALPAKGGTVYFPPGTYAISSPITVTSDGVRLAGAARGSADVGNGSQIKIGSSFTGSAMVQVQESGTPTRPLEGITVAHLLLDGNNTGTAVDGIFFQAYNSLIFDVEVAHCTANGIHVQGVASALWNTYNRKVSHCLTHDNDLHGMWFDANSDDTQEIACHSFANGGDGSRIASTDHTVLAVHHYGNGGHGINLMSGAAVSSVTDSILETNAKSGIYFDDTGSAGIYNVTITGCRFFLNSRAGNNQWDHIQVAGANAHGCMATITGCMFTSYDSVKPRYAVNLTSGQAQKCSVLGNVFDGTWGTAAVHAAGNADTLPCAVRGNVGWNPVGSLTPPSIPASGTALTNPYNYDTTVFVHGGTVTDIAIGGASTGLTSGSFRVPVGQTIKLSYSAAPTWVWLGD